MLVVDDEADVAESTAMLLEELGAKTRIVHSGAEGPATIESFDPHIVLLDLGMSELDGFDSRRIDASTT